LTCMGLEPIIKVYKFEQDGHIGGAMKKFLALFIIVLSISLLVSCGDDKKDVKTTPTPEATDEGIDFNDLLDNTKTPGSATSTPETSTSTPETSTSTPSQSTSTPQPTESDTPGATDVPDYDDDNWTGLY